MKINNVKYQLDMVKYDSQTFLFRAGGWIKLDFEDDIGKSSIKFNIDKDIILDGASIPKPFRWLVKTNYKNMDDNLGWILHDMIFAFGGFTDCPFSFHDANLIFLKVMEYYGTSNRFKRKLQYKAVSTCIGRKCYININRYDTVNHDNIRWEWINVPPREPRA